MAIFSTYTSVVYISLNGRTETGTERSTGNQYTRKKVSITRFLAPNDIYVQLQNNATTIKWCTPQKTYVRN